MKRMGRRLHPTKRPPPPPPTAPPASPAPPPAAAEQAPVQGFAASFKAAWKRKYRELSGQKWQGVSERRKEAEAKARAAAEIARRIERETGRRPAQSTIRRNARKDTTPRGGDQHLLDRQAAIDRAGGVKQFAKKAKLTTWRVNKWRDSGIGAVPGPAGADAARVRFSITCDIRHYNSKGGDTPSFGRTFDNFTPPLGGGDLFIAEPAASTFVAAYAGEDTEALKEILAEQMELQITSEFHGDNLRHDVTVTHIGTLDLLD